MTEAQIIEACPRCDTIIEDDEFPWVREHYANEQALAGATVVDTCPTCGNIVED